MSFIKNNHQFPRLPEFLTPGDTIGIAAPASAFNQNAFTQGIAVLRTLGYNPLVPEDIFQCNRYLAGSDKKRAEILMRLFLDPDVKGVICARGGYGSIRLLPLIDFDAIALRPKVFIGFSDVTALLVNLVERCHWVVFHGPTVTSLSHADAESCLALKNAVSADEPTIIEARNGTVIYPGVASGRLMAGNLTTLSHLVGTSYMPELNGTILLIEDRGVRPYRIDRMLTHMKLAGCFEHLAGLAVGHFTQCGAIAEIEAIIAELFLDYRIPILSGFQVGHEQRNLTLPLGKSVSLDTATQTLSLRAVDAC